MGKFEKIAKKWQHFFSLFSPKNGSKKSILEKSPNTIFEAPYKDAMFKFLGKLSGNWELGQFFVEFLKQYFL